MIKLKKHYLINLKMPILIIKTAHLTRKINNIRIVTVFYNKVFKYRISQNLYRQLENHINLGIVLNLIKPYFKSKLIRNNNFKVREIINLLKIINIIVNKTNNKK